MVAVALAGCYRYVPVDAREPAAEPGSEVRLYLSTDGAKELEPKLGAQTAAVEGRVSAVRPDAVDVVVSSTTKAYGGQPVRWVGEQVTIPRAAITRSERRTLDRRRTIVAGGTAVLSTVATFLILKAVTGSASGSDGGGDPGPTPLRSLP
jgi:hypothetical protein